MGLPPEYLGEVIAELRRHQRTAASSAARAAATGNRCSTSRAQSPRETVTEFSLRNTPFIRIALRQIMKVLTGSKIERKDMPY